MRLPEGNTSSIFKIEDKQSNLEVVYVPSKKKIWSSKSHSVGGSQLSGAFLSLPAAKCLLPLLWLRAFSSPHHWKSFQFQSPQLQTSHLGYSGTMKADSKKNAWIRESSGNIDISQFLDGKSKKVSKPAKHTSSRFGYFPTTVGYTVRRLIFETLTTSSPLWYSQSFFVNSPWNCWFSWWNPGASWLCWFGTLPCRGTGWCLIS